MLAGHDGYHALSDSGWFQLFAKDAQEAADLALIAHRIAELALTPGLVAQDAWLTSAGLASLLLPEREAVAAYLGRPEDLIDTPTPAQQLLFGPKRRRIPELWSVDQPAMTGAAHEGEAYARGLAAQGPYFLAHVAALADAAMEEYRQLTGRPYARLGTYRTDDAEYLLLAQGSAVAAAEATLVAQRASSAQPSVPAWQPPRNRRGPGRPYARRSLPRRNKHSLAHPWSSFARRV